MIYYDLILYYYRSYMRGEKGNKYPHEIISSMDDTG